MRLLRFMRTFITDIIQERKTRNRRDFERNLIYVEYKPHILGNRIRIK